MSNFKYLSPTVPLCWKCKSSAAESDGTGDMKCSQCGEPVQTATANHATSTMDPASRELISRLTAERAALHQQLERASRDIEGYQNALDGTQRVLDETTRERDNYLDTLKAIYARLGIKEGEVPGDEKVSQTVKRFVDALKDHNAQLLRERDEGLKHIERLHKMLTGDNEGALLISDLTEEVQTLRVTLGSLYRADNMLRLRICQRAPQIKAFSDWENHTAALAEAEQALKPQRP